MTKVVVKAGACGFTSVIRAEKGPERMVDITVESGCAMVQKMAVEIARLGRRDALTGLLNNPVYLAAGRYLKHAACPVPSAVLKALEVEAGLNVKKDATIVFEKE
ncbi:MAG: DUF6951 family protein [Candidatus Methylomirabilia bacterium]